MRKTPLKPIYDYSGAKRIKDILPMSFCKTLDLKIGDMPGHETRTKNEYKKRQARKLFYEFFTIMINKCIDENRTFIAPMKRGFSICINEKMKIDKDRILKNKAIYQNVDLINSDFKLYEFMLHARGIRASRYRSIRVNKHFYDRIIENVNNGVRYMGA